MGRVIAAMNITIDGFCDHTAMLPDEEIHEHYTDLLGSADVILYGRITYQLMQYWQPLLKNPTGNKAMDDFAVAIDTIPKLVFSNTMKNLEWESAKLARRSLEEEVSELKQQPGKKNLVGSPGLISSLTKLNLVDEYQLCIHPVIAGKGLRLFKEIEDRIILKLLKTKTFAGGAQILYYERG